MADTIYDDKEKKPELDRIKEAEGIGVNSSNSGGGSSTQSNNFSLYNNGRSTSVDSSTDTDSKSKNDSNSGVQNEGSKNESNSLYKPSKEKSKGSFKAKGSNKKLIYLLGGGGGGVLILLAIGLVFISSLLIPNLAQNILAYQFSRVNRSFEEDNLELTSEKVALDSVADEADADSLSARFSATTDGLFTKLNSFTPGGVVRNLKSDGELSYNTETSRFLKKPQLKSITIGDTTVAVKDDNLASKFSTLRHPIASFQDQVNAASDFSSGLEDAMGDQTGIIIRGAVENQIRKELGISLSAWVVSKFKGDTPQEAEEEMDREAQAIIDPASDTVTPSVLSSVDKADQDGEAQLTKDESTSAGLATIEANGGVDPNVETVENTDLQSMEGSIQSGITSKLSFVYTIALPACIIYDGSLVSPGAGQTIDNQDNETQRSFYLLESAADQQKNGATNAEAVGAFNTKLGNISDSIPEVRAGGGQVDTGSSFLSPQAGAGGQYSLATLLPGPLGSLMNTSGSWICPLLTNTDFIDATILANLAVIVATSIPDAGTAGTGELTAEAGLEASVDTGLQGFANSIADKLTSNVVGGTVLNSAKQIGEMFTKKELLKVGALTGITILAKMAVLAKTHETYNGLSQGTDFANQADAGGNMNANEVMRKEFGGAPLSNTQVAYNNYQDQQYIADQTKHQSAFDRYLAISNPRSLLTRVGTTILGDITLSSLSKTITHVFSDLNPLVLGKHMFAVIGNSTKVAAAAANPTDNADYGIVQWGWTQAEEALMNPNTGDPSYQPLENQEILSKSGQEDYIQTVYSNCFKLSLGNLLTTAPPGSFVSSSTGTTYPNPDPNQPAYIIRDGTGNVTGGLCSQQYLGPSSSDLQAADGSYGNDLIFRWRLAQSYNNTLCELNSISTASADTCATTPSTSTTAPPTNTPPTNTPPTNSCIAPTNYPPPPQGGLAYTNWHFNQSGISAITTHVKIVNNPGTQNQLFLQMYDAKIDNSGQYFGLQTSGIAIFSRFGTTDTSNLKAGPGTDITSGTNEGPFISLRHNFGSLPAGQYTTTVYRSSSDSVGDWFSYYVTYPGKSSVYIGSIRFPRSNPGVPASYQDGGGTWTEDFQNNGKVKLYPVPLWHVAVSIQANNSINPVSAISSYSTMPNSDEYAESPGGYVDQIVGGTTPRCHPAGALW